MTTGLPLTWPLYQSLITGLPVAVTFAIHARAICPAGNEDGRAAARTAALAIGQDDVREERLMREELREQLMAAAGFERRHAGMLQGGGGNRIETVEVLFEVRCRCAGERYRHLLDFALPFQTSAISRPDDRDEQRNEERADRRRQLTADRLTLEELQRICAILAQEQRVGDAGFRETARAEHAAVAACRTANRRAADRSSCASAYSRAGARDLGG